MKIDIFNHIFPKKFFDKMVEVPPNGDGHAQAGAQYPLHRGSG